MIHPGLVVEDYEFVKPVGEGGYSRVWQVKSLRFDMLFVAKLTEVRGDVDGAWKVFDSEIQALMRLNHPNIIRLYGHFRYESNFVLILEHLGSESLEEYIEARGPMKGPLLIQTVKEMCSALNYAWAKGVHHRDVKPANMMFDENGRMKLLDFGISICQTEQASEEVCGFQCSPICAAPEIVMKMWHDARKSDIWAAGITILWIARGAMPWKFGLPSQLMEHIKKGQFIVPEGMDPDIERMVRRMLALNPEERVFPSTEEIGKLGEDVAMVRPKIKVSCDITAVQSVSNCRVGKMVKIGTPLGQFPLRKRLLSDTGMIKAESRGIVAPMSFSAAESGSKQTRRSMCGVFSSPSIKTLGSLSPPLPMIPRKPSVLKPSV